METVLHLSAQLPLVIRGILFENWYLGDLPIKDRKADWFFEGIEEELYRSDLDVEAGARAVLLALSSHISDGEVEKIRKALPHEIGKLWEGARAV